MNARTIHVLGGFVNDKDTHQDGGKDKRREDFQGKFCVCSHTNHPNDSGMMRSDVRVGTMAPAADTFALTAESFA